MRIRCDRYADEKNLTVYFWDVHLPECKKCHYWFESIEISLPFSQDQPGPHTEDTYFVQLPDRILASAKKRVWVSRLMAVAASVAVFAGVTILTGYLLLRQEAMVSEDGYALLGYFNADSPDFLRYGQDGDSETFPEWGVLIEEWSVESGFPNLEPTVSGEEIDEWYESMKNEETGG